ncbi:MAG: hypothetical protein H6Q67_1145 [Firmicutes bacterium]|nr:hypothetical protein [Bacillota bacterium]
MKIDIEFKPINSSYVDEAVNMIIVAYAKERISIPYLPDSDFYKSIYDSINCLFRDGSGVVAIHDNRLVGFLAGFVVSEFFSSYSGIYCPIFGHGAIGEERMEIYQSLYEQVADLWVKNSHVTHAITMFSHDQDLVKLWCWQGFGLRCIDAIRKTSILTFKEAPIQIKKVILDDVPTLANIYTQQKNYYRKSPIFMIKDTEDMREHYNWIVKENHHEWIACKNDIPVGIIRIAPTAETFIAAHPSIMNITRAYVVENERGKGIGTMLLNTVQEWLIQNEYPLCGVDFESINPSGRSFWMKYFLPYTYSLVRKIDERFLR